MHRRIGRKGIVAALGAAVYALFAACGWQVESAGSCNVPRALIMAAALFLPALLILWLLLRHGERKRMGTPEKPFSARRAFCLLLVCYAPMFMIAFPGSFAYDVPFQLRQVFTGAYSTHHPLLHTLLMGGCVALGRAMGSINLGAALYTLVQMTALAACFAGVCASLARSCSARAARRSAVFFAIYPMHMFFAVNATKDVLFSGLFALTLALAYEMIGGEKPSCGLIAGLALCGAGMMLLRNNALYAVIVWLPLLLLLCRKRGAMLIACMLAAVVVFAAANGAMKTMTDAVSGNPSEMLSIPIQQLARARNLASKRLTEGEISAIDRLMPQESWRLYDPTISDPVKFAFDTDAFLADKAGFAKLYLSVGKKCPDVYIDALLAHTLAFWYPYSEYGVSGYYLQMGVSQEQTEQWCDFTWIGQTSPLRRVLDSLSWRFGAKGAMQIPVVGYLFNMGVIVWAMLYFVLREAYAGRWARFAVALLPVLLWGTFLLGPVMAGRYIYPFVCTLPVLAGKPKHVV
ncbi:MAG: hypothetical protein IKB82_06575 [Clostridia bacterium]|nr:hypothetical protein [Clostridia bacterium]